MKNLTLLLALMLSAFIGKNNATFAQNQQAPSPSLPFFDDFENGLEKWIAGNWALTELKSYSKTHSLTDSPDGDYPSFADTEVILKTPVDLSTSIHPVLVFWQYMFTETNIDICYVDISTDGGFNWTTDTTFSGGHKGWHQIKIDLNEYKSTSLLKVKFRLTSSIYTNVDGWYIDDVEIRELDPVQTGFPFADNFENGLLNWITGDWGLCETTYSSASHCITDSPDKPYDSYAHSELILKSPVDLTASNHPVLCFWQKFECETNIDFCLVDISTNGGLYWKTDTFFTGGRNTWNYITIDLSEYRKASRFLVKFKLTSSLYTNVDGWYIDDIEIKELNTSSLSLPFKEIFEKDLDNWRYSDIGWNLSEKWYTSEKFSLTDSPEGDYPSYADSHILLKNPLNTLSANLPVLTFWHKYVVETNIDFCYVDVSTDGGIHWKNLAAYSGGHNTGNFEQLSLANYKSSLFLLRFRLTSSLYTNNDGWYIDDIDIFDMLPSNTVDPTPSNKTQLLVYTFNNRTFITYYLKNPSKRVMIDIFDLSGKMIHTIQICDTKSTDQIEVDTSGLRSGIYICRMKHEHELVTARLIIQ